MNDRSSQHTGGGSAISVVLIQLLDHTAQDHRPCVFTLFRQLDHSLGDGSRIGQEFWLAPAIARVDDYSLGRAQGKCEQIRHAVETAVDLFECVEERKSGVAWCCLSSLAYLRHRLFLDQCILSLGIEQPDLTQVYTHAQRIAWHERFIHFLENAREMNILADF